MTKWEPSGAISDLFARRVGPAILLAAFLAMTYMSWRAWPDLLVDYGRELYIPWRLAEGEVLYTDIAYFNGPLSPYFNSVWFRLFGPGFLTLSIVNLVVAGVVVALLYRLVVRFTRPIVALAVAVFFVLVFAFGQYLRIGNYNYISPYSHEMTHGLVLSLSSISLFIRFLDSRRFLPLVGSGLTLGLAYLTKPEFFLASAFALAAGLIFSTCVYRPSPRRAVARIGCLIIAVIVPPIGAFALLCSAMPCPQALVGTLGGWLAVFDADLTSLPFYRRIMGVDDVGENLWQMAICAGWYAALFVPALILATFPPRSPQARRIVSGLVFIIVMGLLLLVDVAWMDIARPLPLFMLIAFFVVLAGVLRSAKEPEKAPIRVARVTAIVFAGALLAKMMLATRIAQYGFALAMPATVVLLVILLETLPAFIVRRRGYAAVFVAAAVAGICATGIAHLRMSAGFYGSKTRIIATDTDCIRCAPDDRTDTVNRVIEHLSESTAAHETLTVFPEGVMINFLVRRVNPTPFITFMPPELILFDHRRMIAAFEASPPDVVVFIPRKTWEYGLQEVGHAWGEGFDAWVRKEYRFVERIDEAEVFHRNVGVGIGDAANSSLKKRNGAEPTSARVEKTRHLRGACTRFQWTATIEPVAEDEQ